MRSRAVYYCTAAVGGTSSPRSRHYGHGRGMGWGWGDVASHPLSEVLLPSRICPIRSKPTYTTGRIKPVVANTIRIEIRAQNSNPHPRATSDGGEEYLPVRIFV